MPEFFTIHACSGRQVPSRTSPFESSVPATKFFYFKYVVSQSKNVLYQNWLLSGFNTQCPSSGNTTNFDGTPCRCNALKNSSDCVYGTRKSFSPAITSVGVL